MTNPDGWAWVERNDLVSFQHGFSTVATMSVAGVPHGTRKVVLDGICNLLADNVHPPNHAELWDAEQESIGNDMALRDEPCELYPVTNLGGDETIECATHGDDCPDPGPDAA